MKHTVGKTYQAHRALTVAFTWTKLYNQHKLKSS